VLEPFTLEQRAVILDHAAAAHVAGEQYFDRAATACLPRPAPTSSGPGRYGPSARQRATRSRWSPNRRTGPREPLEGRNRPSGDQARQIWRPFPAG
jgi:hypothetical protein